MKRNVWAAGAVAILLAAAATAQTVKPETVGFSTAGLERLHALLEDKVQQKQFAGIVTILARHGKIVDYRAYGKKDLESGAPMDRDAIFRIFSMTKPVTGVAMMQLYEQGKWTPDDPISKHIPEFAQLKLEDGAAPAHAPTMAELMSHTAGFTYGIFGNTPVDKLYRDANLFGSANLQQLIERMAKLPLAYQPGTKWVYSLGVDIQGYIVEKLSGQTLGAYFRDRIFQPLGMKDSGFHVDAEKAGRYATMYNGNSAGQLVAVKTDVATLTKEPGMPSGGGGLYSTASDYYRFAEMLRNGGLLAPSTIKVMRANRLPQSLMERNEFGIGFFRINSGFGFGYDFGVFTDPARIGRPVGAGTYTWDGAASTWFWIDPVNDIVFVGMVHRAGNRVDIATLTQQAVYAALVAPQQNPRRAPEQALFQIR